MKTYTKSFQNYIMQRIEEIIMENTHCQSVSRSVTGKIKELKNILSESQLKIFMEYEELSNELNNCIQSMVFIEANNQGQNRVKIAN